MRKALGGGMRQAGIIAATGIISLNNMINQIKKDHDHVKMLVEGLKNIEGLLVDDENIKSNILYFTIKKNQRRGDKLFDQTGNKKNYPFEINIENICFLETSPDRFRLVTHHGITINDIKKTLDVLNKEMIK